MGNCLSRGKSSSDTSSGPRFGQPSNFKGPGRTLGSAPAGAGASTGGATLPPATTTYGTTGGAGAGAGAAAARAAEEREARERDKAGKGGKLAKQLAAQKGQSHAETMRGAAEAEVRAREIDEGTRRLAHS